MRCVRVKVLVIFDDVRVIFDDIRVIFDDIRVIFDDITKDIHHNSRVCSDIE